MTCKNVALHRLTNCNCLFCDQNEMYSWSWAKPCSVHTDIICNTVQIVVQCVNRVFQNGCVNVLARMQAWENHALMITHTLSLVHLQGWQESQRVACFHMLVKGLHPDRCVIVTFSTERGFCTKNAVLPTPCMPRFTVFQEIEKLCFLKYFLKVRFAKQRMTYNDLRQKNKNHKI